MSPLSFGHWAEKKQLLFQRKSNCFREMEWRYPGEAKETSGTPCSIPPAAAKFHSMISEIRSFGKKKFFLRPAGCVGLQYILDI
ncbi:hypothetical protein HMPREF0372_00256, partial [Flavonifractor plautii ATCC 29863]